MSSPFLGDIRMFAGNFAPRGNALCNGQLLPVSQNTALFSLIGTTYGGDGINTFALPDLRSRFPVHQGTGVGLTPRVMGQVSGEESVTLLLNTIPTHTHPANCNASIGDQSNPQNNFWAATSGAAKLDSSAAANVTLNNASVVNTGGNQPHENRPPFLAVNFIIALDGIFPSQN
jgi:microcystin-dependent protein